MPEIGEKWVPNLPNEDFELIAKTHHNFQQDKFDLGKPFPKAKKTLKQLKTLGFKVAAVSNRTRDSLHIALKKAKLSPYFDFVVSAEDVKNPKPHKDHVLAALEYLNIESVNSFMVGDTEHDILAGKSAGTKTIGVTYGFAGKEIVKHNPDFIIDNIEEVLNLLK